MAKRYVVCGKVIGGMVGLLLLAGCQVAPETGRKQLILISPGEEMQLGLASFDQMKREVPICKDPAINATVQKVGARVSKVATLPDAQWEFVVFESKEANAFCLPGGKVGIYTGILPITKDEAGLATVIAHEVAHAVARHGAERMTEGMLIQGGGQALNTALKQQDPKWQSAASTTYGLGSQLLVALPHSRSQESEADHIGLLYMARAGYPPEASIGFWERFAAYNKTAGGATPWFLRTHPLDERRIQDLKAWLPRAQQEFRPQ